MWHLGSGVRDGGHRSWDSEDCRPALGRPRGEARARMGVTHVECMGAQMCRLEAARGALASVGELWGGASLGSGMPRFALYERNSGCWRVGCRKEPRELRRCQRERGGPDQEPR